MILLVVGSAVTCPDRSHHIARILSTTDIKESSIITYHTQQVNCIKLSYQAIINYYIARHTRQFHN